ncbi:MAG TPA: SpoIIIAH-like family protein [Candidatus Blautia merdigallinarum]|uniref:SpoIIIAH-like family protein n=1 Tax=Candidatus Blautia merdigallinarum TaxID=2838495 RepID=A0A9D2N3D1_9FIRM|nr:SpoIIIAH-like family protein [Candidatus Blautia merdigallinarum]
MKKIFKKNQVIITALAIMIAVAGYINYSDDHLGMDSTLESLGSDGEGDAAQTASDTDGIVEEIESLDYDLTDETALLEENSQAAQEEDAQGQDTQAQSEDTQDTENQEIEAQEGTDTADASGGDAAQTETPGEAVLTGASNFAAQAKISREQVRSANKETLLEIINNENLGDEQKQEAVNSMVNMTDLAEQEEAAELLLEAQGFTDVVVNLTGESADVIVPQAYMEDASRAQIEDIVKRKTSVPVENIVITPLEEGTEGNE